MFLMTAPTYSVFGLMGLGRLAQTWAANSLSRWASYFCFISSSDWQRAHRRAERPSCTRSKRSPENPASQSKPACVAWPQYKPTLCEKEQCSEAAACLQSGRKCPTTQEEEAGRVQDLTSEIGVFRGHCELAADRDAAGQFCAQSAPDAQFGREARRSENIESFNTPLSEEL